MVEETATTRTLHLCGYVNLSLDDVFGLFDRPDVEELLASSLRKAMGSTGERMSLTASGTEQLSDTSARVFVHWRSTDREGQTYEGGATISLMVVQSGADPITELLVALPVDERVAAWVAAATRRFLDDVTARLAVVIA